jgi:tRNA G10  N-methylase Trm11
MDPQLSLLMANLTKVDRTHLVFDPFVGTGKALKDFKVAPN